MNGRHGALVLSTNAGAFERISRHALAVNPFDIDETADAIALAFEMDAEDREKRARGLSRSVLAHTPESWLWSQLEGLDAALRRTGRQSSEGTEQGREPGGAFDDHIGSGPVLRSDRAQGPSNRRDRVDRRMQIVILRRCRFWKLA